MYSSCTVYLGKYFEHGATTQRGIKSIMRKPTIHEHEKTTGWSETAASAEAWASRCNQSHQAHGRA